MQIIGAIIIGLIVGIIAKFLMPGRDPGGFIITILIGIAGSVVATMAGRAIGWYAEGEAAGFIASILGAMFLLWVYRMVTRRSGRRS
ncbi:GlsB/YeaQ/YmgE family stress response membrane protein [Telmatospirillum sp. J64-1]|uniref:GlsB/YeaQ/YmgE family stress response membrane protein n=1 Tax=Telmatospirillum sp. J64-1 TaxID=2502183 RepID=UPI00115EE103|nr:GlsB/YeaQ/YmgE family stress response membrane protein [Telmatospirillum sp. J64-1]